MVQTATNTSEAAPASGPLTVDRSFVKSITGILFMVQIACSFLAVVLGIRWGGPGFFIHAPFLMTAAAILVSSSSVFVARVINLDRYLTCNFNWLIIFPCYSGPASQLALGFSCAKLSDSWDFFAISAGVFGLFTWKALLICFLLHFKPFWIQRRRQQAGTSHSNSGAPRDVVLPDESEASDDWSDGEETEATAEVALAQATARPPSANFP